MSVHRFAVSKCIVSRSGHAATASLGRHTQGDVFEACSQPLPERSHPGKTGSWERCSLSPLALVVREPGARPRCEPAASEAVWGSQETGTPTSAALELVAHEPPHEIVLESMDLSRASIARSRLSIWRSADMQLWIKYQRSDGMPRRLRVTVERETTFISCISVLERFCVVKQMQGQSGTSQPGSGAASRAPAGPPAVVESVATMTQVVETRSVGVRCDGIPAVLFPLRDDEIERLWQHVCGAGIARPKLTVGTALPGTARGTPSPPAETALAITATPQKHPFGSGGGGGSGVGGGVSGPGDGSDFEDGCHDIVELSADLDKQLAKVLDNSDALDRSDFDCIEYANHIFPSEQSLATADRVLEKLRHQIRLIDRGIKDLVRHQTDASQQTKQELEDVKQAILDLVARIKTIKSKAAESEKMVLEITHDIKSLDQAKKNLTHSINVLRRLQMFVTALEQLRGVANRKQYRETAHLLQVTLQLVDHFKGYKNVKQVAALCDAVAQFQGEIRRTIFNEFESSFAGGTYKMQAQVLNDACLVVETLGLEPKLQLIDWYCDMQLKDYRSIFRTNPEVAGLKDISRRCAWLKRTLKTHDEQHASLFPPEWRVSECLTVKFCEDTRKDLSEVLSASEKDGSLDTIVMLQAIQTTMEFEGKLDKRFTIRDPAEIVRDDSELAPSTSKFFKIISICFEQHLWHYIEMEDKTLAEKFEAFKSQAPFADEEAVLTSSTDLFLFYRQTIVNGARLSTRKPFLDLCKMLGKWLKKYCDFLLGKLPKDEKRVPTDEDVRVICLTINTADYCCTTTAQLEEKLIEKIDEEFRGLLSLSQEREAFLGCSAQAVQALVRAIENATDPSFQAMTKRPWGTLPAVGDQSEHITAIAATLSQNIKIIRATIASSKYFRLFCDKFAESFTAKYLANIYKCRPLSEVGAEQMLLDTHALKNILTEMSTLGADPPAAAPPAAYVKILAKGITKIEQLLKVVLRPQDPPDIIVDTYNLLYADYSIGNFQKILELKGLRRSEMQPILDVFQIKIPAGAQPAASAAPAAPADATRGAAAAAAAAAIGMGAFKSDFRKFMNNMNIKRT